MSPEQIEQIIAALYPLLLTGVLAVLIVMGFLVTVSIHIFRQALTRCIRRSAGS